jgi:hypothetical protein
LNNAIIIAQDESFTFDVNFTADGKEIVSVAYTDSYVDTPTGILQDKRVKEISGAVVSYDNPFDDDVLINGAKCGRRDEQAFELGDSGICRKAGILAIQWWFVKV